MVTVCASPKEFANLFNILIQYYNGLSNFCSTQTFSAHHQKKKKSISNIFHIKYTE